MLTKRNLIILAITMGIFISFVIGKYGDRYKLVLVDKSPLVVVITATPSPTPYWNEFCPCKSKKQVSEMFAFEMEIAQGRINWALQIAEKYYGDNFGYVAMKLGQAEAYYGEAWSLRWHCLGNWKGAEALETKLALGEGVIKVHKALMERYPENWLIYADILEGLDRLEGAHPPWYPDEKDKKGIKRWEAIQRYAQHWINKKWKEKDYGSEGEN